MSSASSYELITHTFKGGRFADHGVDIDVLTELIAFKTILVETAKELWKSRHPDRKRLPRRFEDSLSLKFYEIRPTSAGIPIVRENITPDGQLLVAHEPDELDEAVSLIPEVISSLSEGRNIPDAFPRSLIPYFESYGKTLREEESYELRPAGGNRVVRYTQRERESILRLESSLYRDKVELSGEIRLADLDGGNFAVRSSIGERVSGKFSPDQESLIVDALREHADCWLHIEGIGEF